MVFIKTRHDPPDDPGVSSTAKKAEEERVARLRGHPLYPELYRHKMRALAAKQGNPRAALAAQGVIDRVVQIEGVISRGLDDVSELALEAYRIAVAKFEECLALRD